jgi:hypothetical protein
MSTEACQLGVQAHQYSSTQESTNQSLSMSILALSLVDASTILLGERTLRQSEVPYADPGSPQLDQTETGTVP